MEIPQFRLDRQTDAIKKELRQAFDRVLDSGQFVLGAEVQSFEKQFCDFVHAKHCNGVTSGTDALILALRACGVEAGDFVLTSPFTFFATASAILAIGAEPVFADIDPNTFNLDPQSVEQSLKGESVSWNRKKIDPKKIKAIIPVHLYGLCADMGAFQQIAKKFSIALIEDAAQAFGSRIGNDFAGTFGDAAAFSFFPTKNLGALGDAGCATTQRDDVAEKLALLRVHGSKQRYIHEVVGGNYRIDALQAALLSCKMPFAQGWIDRRIQIAAQYTRQLSQCKSLQTPFISQGYQHSFHQYTIKVEAKVRDSFIMHLASCDIGSMPYYPLCVHLQPALSKTGWSVGDFPEAEKCSTEVVSLPMYPELTDDEIGFVCTSIKDFFTCHSER